MSVVIGHSGTPDRNLLSSMQMVLSQSGSGSLLHQTAKCSLAGKSACPGSPRRLPTNRPARDEYVVVLNGHIDSGLLKGDTFDLDHYLRDKSSYFNGLCGRFVLIVVSADSVTLVRDAVGEKSLYYAVCAGRLLFSSESKAIALSSIFTPCIREAAIAQYLSCSYLPGVDTMLHGLSQLLPGQYAEFDLTTHEVCCTQYHRFEFDAETAGDCEIDWTEEFRSRLTRAVAQRLPADPTQPVGVYLSGGLDSSLVTAELVRRHPNPVITFSLHFGGKYASEREYAKLVADHLGTQHHDVEVTPRDFQHEVLDMVWKLDMPIGDPVTVGNFILSRYARQHVDHIFNGEGGDPCFGGPKNIPMMLNHWYAGAPLSSAQRARQYLRSYERCFEELPRLLNRELVDRIDVHRDLEMLFVPFFENSDTDSLLKKLVLINIRTKGAQLILPKVERMTGSSGLAVGSPLFDRKLAELALALPGQMLLRGSCEKYVMKQAFASELPAVIVDREKSGMRVPVYHWFGNEMNAFARRLFRPAQIDEIGWFDAARIKQLIAYDTDDGRGRYGLRLWMLMTLEVWRRIVFEGERP